MTVTLTGIYYLRKFIKKIKSQPLFVAKCLYCLNKEQEILETLRKVIPPLSLDKYKGQAGKIAVIGGSLEYTGAPYFAAISALRIGADLAQVFCPKIAGPVIKSYSPELIVHPVLDAENGMSKVKEWLDRFNVIVIGPGLGRENSTFEILSALMEICRQASKPLVIDADALFFIAKDPKIVKDYPPPGVILTPNMMEYARLSGSENPNMIPNPNKVFELGKNVRTVVKGPKDQILISPKRKVFYSGKGSGRRCGGQGDLLCGALATFYCWTLQSPKSMKLSYDDKTLLAAYAACKLTRECNIRAFKKYKRSTVTTDMIQEIHDVFEDIFETNCL